MIYLQVPYIEKTLVAAASLIFQYLARFEIYTLFPKCFSCRCQMIFSRCQILRGCFQRLRPLQARLAGFFHAWLVDNNFSSLQNTDSTIFKLKDFIVSAFVDWEDSLNRHSNVVIYYKQVISDQISQEYTRIRVVAVTVIHICLYWG